MAQESLLRKLEEAAGRIKVLERERNEAVGKIQSLEREANELRNLISLAESKADEMLKGGPVPEASKGPAAARVQVSAAPRASKGLEELVEPSPSQQEELRKRFPNAFTSA
jgi:chromosome segregation ATPase